MLLPATLMFHRSVGMTPDKYTQAYNTDVSQQLPLVSHSFVLLQYKGLQSELPRNVHMLTLQYLTQTEILLRLEHQYEAQEDKILSEPVTINIEVYYISTS